jgi:hypothetical protein
MGFWGCELECSEGFWGLERIGEYGKRERRRENWCGGDIVYMWALWCLFFFSDERANLHPRRTGEPVLELHKLTMVMEQLSGGDFQD